MSTFSFDDSQQPPSASRRRRPASTPWGLILAIAGLATVGVAVAVVVARRDTSKPLDLEKQQQDEEAKARADKKAASLAKWQAEQKAKEEEATRVQAQLKKIRDDDEREKREKKEAAERFAKERAAAIEQSYQARDADRRRVMALISPGHQQSAQAIFQAIADGKTPGVYQMDILQEYGFGVSLTKGYAKAIEADKEALAGFEVWRVVAGLTRKPVDDEERAEWLYRYGSLGQKGRIDLQLAYRLLRASGWNGTPVEYRRLLYSIGGDALIERETKSGS